jgi:hypothetical protein
MPLVSVAFEIGDRVSFVGHPDHSPPPALEGVVGWHGAITAVKGGDLYDVGLDDADPVPMVQLHGAQLARIITTELD